MTDKMLVAIYFPLAIISAVMTVASLLARGKNRLTINIVFFSIALFGWQVFCLLFHLISETWPLKFLHDMKLPFVSLSAVALLLLVLRFYSLDRYLSATMVALLLIIPVLTAAFSATTDLHGLIRIEFTVLETYPYHIYTNVRGIWFWIHSIYCYSLMILAFAIAIFQHSKLPVIFRPPSRFVMFGLIFALGSNLAFMILPAYIDLPLIGASAGIFPLFFATTKNRGLDYIMNVRNRIFDYIDENILLLNSDRKVLDWNAGFERMLAGIGVNVRHTNYAEIVDRMCESATSFQKSGDDEQGIDLLWDRPDGDVIFNLRERPILDRRGNVIGIIVINEDVSENRALISSIEVSAEVDALTGLHNRRNMERIRAELDTPERLPLGVIIGDVNGLKTVNDTLGHQQGDVLLRVAAELLESVCPSDGHVFRIGGDEFLFFLPNTTLQQLRATVTKAEKLCADIRDYPFKLSIALGYAMKETPDQDLSKVLHSADGFMYMRKKSEKT